MPTYAAKPDGTFTRAHRQWVYGRIDGAAGDPGVLQWQLIEAEWVMIGGVWKLCHRDGGLTVVSNLSIAQTPAPSTNGTELPLAASAVLQDGTSWTDYDYAWNSDSGSVFTYAVGPEARVESEPAQQHIVDFSIRRKARTDGDAGGWTAPGPWVNSGPFYITDPRDPI